MAAIEKVSWLVLGGSGQLGRALSLKLEKEGASYTLLNRADLDITNPEEVHKSISLYKPGVVLNAAAWTNVELTSV